MTLPARRSGQVGFTMIETLVALVLVALLGTAFLSALATVARGTMVADEQTAAHSLAQSQMESAKAASYITGATSYSPSALPSDAEYTGYAIGIAALAIHTPDDGIQKLTVTVSKNNRQILSLEGYKVNR